MYIRISCAVLTVHVAEYCGATSQRVSSLVAEAGADAVCHLYIQAVHRKGLSWKLSNLNAVAAPHAFFSARPDVDTMLQNPL